MSIHRLPETMPTAAKVATYLARAANARKSVQDGEWLNAEAEQDAKFRARIRIQFARAARLSAVAAA